MENFKSVYKNGFALIVENELTKVLMVRSYCSILLNFYFEELIYTIRSYKKKKMNGTQIKRYKLNYFPFDLKCKEGELSRKELTDEDKKIDNDTFTAKLMADKATVEEFLNNLSPDAKHPFCPEIDFNINKDYINSITNKIDIVARIVKCERKELQSYCVPEFRTYFSGKEGQVILEAALFLRKDGATIFKESETLKFLVNLIND